MSKSLESVTLTTAQIAQIYKKFTQPQKLELVGHELNLTTNELSNLLENYKSLSALGRIKLPENQVQVFRKYYK